MYMIVGRLNPVGPQMFYVWNTKTNEVEKSYNIMANKFSSMIFSLVEEYNEYTVNLHGPVTYVNKLIKDFREEEIKKYSEARVDFQLY